MEETNFAQIDETNYATPEDIAQFKGRIIEPEYRMSDFEAGEEDPRSNRVDARTLKPDYAIGRGGGSKNKGRTKTVKRLTGPQRIEKHLNIVKNSEVLAETPQQRRDRKITEALAEFERQTTTGRPRKDKELREPSSFSASVDHIAANKEAGVHSSEALIAHAEYMRAA